MSADPEEDVLLSQFEKVLDSPPMRLAIEDMVAMDVKADLVKIRQQISGTPFTLEEIEQLLTTSAILKSNGVVFEPVSERIWQLVFQGKAYTGTFYPEVFNENPSLHLRNFGDPLFEELLQTILTFIHKKNSQKLDNW